MDIETEQTEGGVAVLRPTGRLTMVAAPQLRARVGEVVAGGAPKVVLDMAGVEFMDSSGLGALIASLKTARQAGGDLRIAALAPQVLTVLQLTNLDRVIRPHASVEDALRGLA